jgi:threonine/homoserine/homoserine lactone efflux protein
MIPLHTFLIFALTSLALVLVPGPNHIYIAARGIAQGRAAGVASALGVETGTMVHIAAAAGTLGRRVRNRSNPLGYLSGVIYLELGIATAFSGRSA